MTNHKSDLIPIFQAFVNRLDRFEIYNGRSGYISAILRDFIGKNFHREHVVSDIANGRRVAIRHVNRVNRCFWNTRINIRRNRRILCFGSLIASGGSGRFNNGTISRIRTRNVFNNVAIASICSNGIIRTIATAGRE